MEESVVGQDAYDVRHWWRTAIIDMSPGKIRLRGRPVEELIGNFTLVETIWLMLRGEKPDPRAARLLEAALVAGVDHGPQAPSIAAARMAATCGVGLNNVMATAINMLGDVHGGAGEQCAELFYRIDACWREKGDLETAVRETLGLWREQHGKIVPGFGHRFHKPVDPRAPRLMKLTRDASDAGVVGGRFVEIGESVQQEVGRLRGDRPIAMNIDGATAVIFSELGFPPPLARGLFCLSRAVGILAHGWEQIQQGGRNKGPIPPRFLPEYLGSEVSSGL